MLLIAVSLYSQKKKRDVARMTPTSAKDKHGIVEYTTQQKHHSRNIRNKKKTVKGRHVLKRKFWLSKFDPFIRSLT